MIHFIIYFLFFVWVSTAIFKMEIPNKFYNLVSTDFVDRLTNCEFCMETHISFILSLLGFCFVEPNTTIIFYDIFAEYYLIAFAPLGVALSHILKGFYR